MRNFSSYECTGDFGGQAGDIRIMSHWYEYTNYSRDNSNPKRVKYCYPQANWKYHELFESTAKKLLPKVQHLWDENGLLKANYILNDLNWPSMPIEEAHRFQHEMDFLEPTQFENKGTEPTVAMAAVVQTRQQRRSSSAPPQ